MKDKVIDFSKAAHRNRKENLYKAFSPIRKLREDEIERLLAVVRSHTSARMT